MTDPQLAPETDEDKIRAVTELRLALIDAGFASIPLYGKEPPIYQRKDGRGNNKHGGLTGWQNLHTVTPEQVRMWGKTWPDALGTGILCRLTPAADIDILNPDAADAIETLGRERFEESGFFMVRIGRAPKRAFLLRTDEPFPKITSVVFAADGSRQRIEVLGDGEQLAAFGIHPETQQPYRWHGGEPGLMRREDLPYIREADAREFVEAATRLLVDEFGYSLTDPSEPQKSDGPAPQDVEDAWCFATEARLRSALAFIPADEAALAAKLGNSHDAFVKIGRAIERLDWGAKGLALWSAWCSQSPKFDAAGLQTQWLSFHRTRDSRSNPVTIGTVFYYAQQFGWSEEKRAEPQVELEAVTWWRDPATIPPREFLYGRHYIRKTIGASIGAGGRLKTTHSLFEAVEMTSGRNLTTGEPTKPLRVVCLNAEEDQDELDRRLAAICQHYGVTEADLGQRLIVKSLRDRPLRLATLVHGVATLNQPALAALAGLIKRHRADVFMLDPWVSFHAVNESSNTDMDLVIKTGLGMIAAENNSAGEIFHHPGKPKPGSAETTVEDARGASAILWAVRSARVFNFMTPDEANKLGISEDDRRKHIRVSNGKANMGPIGGAEWIEIKVEPMPNGDEVAFSSRWKPPNPFEGVTTADMATGARLAATGEYRADSRSPQWFGFALADLLKIPVAYGADNNQKDIARINTIIKTWIKNKVIRIEMRADAKSKDRKFIVPGSASPAKPGVDDPLLADDEITLQ